MSGAIPRISRDGPRGPANSRRLLLHTSHRYADDAESSTSRGNPHGDEQAAATLNSCLPNNAPPPSPDSSAIEEECCRTARSTRSGSRARTCAAPWSRGRSGGCARGGSRWGTRRVTWCAPFASEEALPPHRSRGSQTSGCWPIRWCTYGCRARRAACSRPTVPGGPSTRGGIVSACTTGRCRMWSATATRCRSPWPRCSRAAPRSPHASRWTRR